MDLEFIQTVTEKCIDMELNEIEIQAFHNHEMTFFTLNEMEGNTTEEKITTAIATLHEFICFRLPNGDRIFK